MQKLFKIIFAQCSPTRKLLLRKTDRDIAEATFKNDGNP